MNRFDRIYQLHAILAAARRPVSMRRLLDEMECSRATIKRVIQEMRLYLGAPIEYDREQNGYYYDRQAEYPYELPGLWFNASELFALLTMQQLLTEVQPGLLQSRLEPLQKRIEQILASQRLSSSEISHRVRIPRMAARPVGRHFQTITDALMRRKRIQIHYHARQNNQRTERLVSPQRIVYYRENWYLDAWCHQRRALRTFSLDRILKVSLCDQKTREFDEAHLDRHLTSAYGIFSGRPSSTAVLRFTPERARWVADEHWHPEQKGRYLEDGRYELCIPYGDARELVMDILKYGPDVEVVAPLSLREQVADRLCAAAAVYAHEDRRRF